MLSSGGNKAQQHKAVDPPVCLYVPECLFGSVLYKHACLRLLCFVFGFCCVCAALITEDFGLLQLYAESFQTGGALATYLKSFRAASKKKAKAKAEGDKPEPVMTPSNASTIVMVTASALAAQVYPDSRFGSLHAKQLTGRSAYSSMLVPHVSDRMRPAGIRHVEVRAAFAGRTTKQDQSLSGAPPPLSSYGRDKLVVCVGRCCHSSSCSRCLIRRCSCLSFCALPPAA